MRRNFFERLSMGACLLLHYEQRVIDGAVGLCRNDDDRLSHALVTSVRRRQESPPSMGRPEVHCLVFAPVAQALTRGPPPTNAPIFSGVRGRFPRVVTWPGPRHDRHRGAEPRTRERDGVRGGVGGHVGFPCPCPARHFGIVRWSVNDDWLVRDLRQPNTPIHWHTHEVVPLSCCWSDARWFMTVQ